MSLALRPSAIAQDNSPYSQFGFGETRDQSPASLNSWCPSCASFQDPYRFTISNPASLGTLDRSLLQAGIYFRTMTLEAGDRQDRFSNVVPEYLTLAFSPLKKNWSLSAGLVPYSKMDYNIKQFNPSSGNGLPPDTSIFRGKGGLYEGYGAFGYNYKQLSIGVKTAYLFGTMNKSTTVRLQDTVNVFNTRYREQTVYRGFSWKAGLQYSVKTTSTQRLVFGVAGQAGLNIGAMRDFVYERVYSGVDLAYDTIFSSFGQRGTVTLPATVETGFMYTKFASENSQSVRWQVGTNLSYSSASSYRSFGAPDSLVNAYRVSVGLEWTPREEAIEGFYNRVRYRVGVYYGEGPLLLRKQVLTQMGALVGFGIPIRKTSFIDISVDFGSHGTAEQNLLKEKYIRGVVGFSLSDVWFLQRRYD